MNDLGARAEIDVLGSAEARMRFENLIMDIVSELASSRMITFVSANA
jgi:hypothetical protein